MSLDLGALVGRVVLDDVQFSRTYVSVVRRMQQLGVTADRSATGLGRVDQALTETGLSASDAAAATQALTAAQARNLAVTTEQGLAASKLTQAELRLVAAQVRLEELETSGTATTRQLASARASAIAATDRQALAEERLGKATGLTASAWQATGRGMLAAGAVVALGFGLAEKAAANFDARMALVRTLARANTSEMQALRTAALSTGQAYGYTANQVSDAEAELVKAGISVRDIVGGALRGALTLAAAGQEDVAQATETAAIAMTQFKLKGRDVPHIADLLAAGADKALGSVSDLSEALKYGGLAASQAGFSIESTVGTLAEFAQAGLIGSSAGTGLQQMLRNLQKPSTEAAGVMKRLGIEVYDQQGKMLSLSQIAGELHNKIGKLPQAERDTALATLFTSRSVRAANILMRDGAKANAEWTAKVNDAGFAALQASGKLNSLSGDATKLKAALTTAFIGAGEGGQGPLRVMVQDLTAVVNAWNALPGPVRDGVLALGGVVGAATLVGGALLILIPKFKALDDALLSMTRGAYGARGALAAIGKGGLIVGVLAAVTLGAKTLGDTFIHNTAPAVNDFTAALLNLSNSKIADLATSQINMLAAAVVQAKWGVGSKAIGNLDAALAGLVTSGHADVAATSFARLSVELHRQGLSSDEIAKKLPQYSSALSDSAASATAAGTGVDQFGNAVTAAAKETQKATDAAKAYRDQLHALADPLFAMNQALTDLRSKQKALTLAVHKHGAESKAARQAQLALASSALDVATASRDLTAGIKAGTTSLAQAKDQLHAWVAAGLLTKAQADAVATSFGGLIGKARDVTQSLREAGGGAKTAGRGIGVDFGQGIVDGLHSKDAAVRQAAQLQAAQLDKAARLAIQAHSPSRVAHKTGSDYGQGLADGLTDSQQKVADAATALAQKAVDAARQTLDSDKAKLQADLGVRSQTTSGIASNLLGPLDLSNAVINGRVGNLSAFLKAGTGPLHRLHHEERLLRDAGLSPKLLAQIANAPVTSGIALATNILSGRSGSIAHLDHLARRARISARGIGGLVAHQLYDPRIEADRKDVHDSLLELRKIRDVLHEVKQVIKQNPNDLAGALDRVVSGLDHKQHARAGSR